MTPERKLLALFALVFAGVLLNAVISLRSARAIIRIRDSVEKSHRVLEVLGATLSAAKDVETGQRGYAITGDDAYLEPYQSALAGVDHQLNALGRLVADDPGQRQRFSRLQRDINARLQLSREVVASRREKGFEAARQLTLTGRGRREMQNLRRTVWEMEAEERAKLAQRAAQAAASTAKAIATFSIATFLSLLLLAQGYVVIRRRHRERDQAEQMLRKSEAGLREAQRIAHQGSWEWDLVKNELRWSDETFRLFGLAPRTVQPTLEMLLNVMHPDDRERVSAKAQEAAREGKSYYDEHRIVLPDGSERIIRGQGEPVRDEAGNVVCLVGTVLDITESKRAEEALRQSEARYRSLVQGAGYGICRAALDGRFLDVNPALVEMLGYDSAEELMQRNLKEIYRDPEEHTRLLQRYAEGDRLAGVEVEWKRKNGSFITVRLSGRALRGASGLEACEVIAEDITERSLLQRQLYQAQRMEAVGRLAGGIAHDFNNLLTVIKGYSDVLLDQLSQDTSRYRAADQISKAAGRAASLTQQLLAFSRKQVLQPTVVDLNGTVNNIHKMLRRLIGEDIELVTLLGPSLRSVKVDVSQIEQVILNLAVNARDAMLYGGKLTIETANVELDEVYAQQHAAVQPGSYVMLAFSDTGTGMDAETQARIFEPFFTTKEKGKGTGLGLATVYGIVKQSGGYIWLYSEPGQGSTFKIYFPVVEEPVEAVPARPAGVASPGGSETVLVVEDEDRVRELIGELLRRKGYKVLEASDGTTALELAVEHPGPLHLLLTDVVMRGMSGRELAQRIAALHPSAKVLFMSGYTDNAIVHHGVLGPGIALLQKPFTVETLTSKVREVLGSP